ncbi:MAG TPA: hypothetical protein VM328_08435 [Fimbriimonadaceae bacterium]|nr:hypothetical protein [Fimbriimonadaceae bacterium]
MASTLGSPAGITLLEEELGGYGGFPDRLYVIGVGADRYAANNATLPDGQNVNGLATFPTPDDATTYMGMLAGLGGEIMAKSFEEAREIAKSKPVLSCLFLFVGGKIVEVHYVR